MSQDLVAGCDPLIGRLIIEPLRLWGEILSSLGPDHPPGNNNEFHGISKIADSKAILKADFFLTW